MSGILQGLIASISSAAAAVTDTYFNLVTLLLNTTSTNGAQNNTFLDSSTNNFTITRNGNTTQGTFTPFSQTGWSNYVGTTAQYLTVTGQPLINVNDWTVEFWIYPTQFNSGGGLFGASNGGGTNPKLYFYCSTTNLQLTYYSGGFTTILANATPTLNQWTYVSVSRSSSTGLAYLYYNGVLQQSATAAAITGITGGFTLFSDGEGSSAGFYGYMSNARVSNVARYTGSSYSVPTAPSTAISNTTLLTAQSNRFVDNSTNGYAIAVTGTPSVQAFSPFAPTAAYDASVVGGSAYNDGTGDYLTIATNANLTLGSSDFTIELWWYPTAFNSDSEILSMSSTGGTNRCYSLYGFGSNGSLAAYAGSGGSSWDIVNNLSIGTAVLNAWNHVAFTRSGTTFSTYLNGNRIATTTNSGTLGSNALGVFASNSGTGQTSAGYMGGARTIKGTALYTGATYTIPTAPFTAVTNTNLLLNFTNGGIYDSASKNVLETVGNAQVSTTQAKWGTTSMYFDGVGDCLQYPASQNFLFNGDFTIEGWFNRDNGADNSIFIMNISGSNYFGVNVNSAGYNVYLNSTGPAFSPSVTLSNGTWYYFALVRSGSTVTLYHNGTSVGSTTNSSALGSSSVVAYVGGVGGGLKAYVDDLRITKYARTITTSPSSAFPLQ